MRRRDAWLVAVALAAAGCSDALEQTSSSGQVIAVVNSNHTVSFVAAADLSVRTVDLQAGGAAITAAGRGSTVLVPLGSADSVAVINNAGLCTTGLCVRPVVVLPLARGSGATGVVIQDDSGRCSLISSAMLLSLLNGAKLWCGSEGSLRLTLMS